MASLFKMVMVIPPPLISKQGDKLASLFLIIYLDVLRTPVGRHSTKKLKYKTKNKRRLC